MKTIDKIKDSIKRFDEFQSQGLIDLACDYSTNDKGNLLNCSNCGYKLGLWRQIYHARKVERGQYYKIRCKNCKHINKIKRRLKE